jgi:CDP-glucose 4,6-dehydratase
MVNLSQAFEGKRIWLSGHTGFKGSWLSEWLLDLGAIVHGYALAPNTTPSLFDQLGLATRLDHEFLPDFVIHMAAQPLVRRSYAIPVETYATNVMGTIHVLEAMKGITHSCAAVIVTTDKCYENHESGREYEESDPLGGRDPYSSSKAMAEIAISAYRDSYFKNHPVRISSARAGNVIGGGDWAEDRIVPDAIKALNQGQKIRVRNPGAVRPWQHVLEPLGGYLTLAAALSKEASLATSFNFGPGPDSNRTVAELVTEILKNRQGLWEDTSNPVALHEATLLTLSIQKADEFLSWKPRWNFEETIQRTVTWYDQVHNNLVTPLEITRGQIAEYSS